MVLRTGELTEADIIKEIVMLCGGQPSKMKHLFNDS